MPAGLVLLGVRGRVYFPLLSHIYFAFRNQKVFKEFFLTHCPFREVLNYFFMLEK